jgi:trk system potassium uptake protein TrkA
MNFIVVGCGRVGAELCYHLFKNGHQVVVVDINKESFNRLHPDFRGRTLEGEGLADGLAAVTNSDTLNAVVAHAARTIFNVPNVVARNYDPNLRPIIEAFGLQTVGSTYWGAQRVEELLINPSQRAVYSAGNGEVEVYELSIPEQWAGKTVNDLLAPVKDCYPVALSKAGRSALPDANIVLQKDDVLSVSSTFEGIGQLTARLAGKVEA